MSSIVVRSRAGWRATLLAGAGWVALVAGEAGAAEADQAVAAAEKVDSSGPAWLHGWSPLADVELAVHAQELKATGETTFGARDSGTNTVSTLLVRLEAGVLTPNLGVLPGAPRLVIRGGGSFSLRESSTISSTQRLAGAELGTDFATSWKDMWHAGLDLQFRFPIGDQVIVIQPGVEYLQSRFRFEPHFTFRAQPGSPEAQGFPNPQNPPTLNFNGRSGSDVNRFVGPSLAIESEVLRVGPLRVGVYLQGRMYWLLGDRDTTVSFARPLNGQPQSATARMEANFLAGQVGFGLRGRF
ncbi:MAG: hypothetical protein R3F35_18100 [Myxococcota bacterium]